MAIGCNCDNGLSNTGRPNCVPIQSVTSKLIMVPKYANDGSINSIDLTATLPVWSTLINQTDVSKRWFPLPNFENVELAKADTTFEEANSGRMVFIRQGKRSFAGELWADDSSPQFLGKLQTNRCVEFGVYIVDVNGNLVGSKVGTKLFPISVDNPSFDPKIMFATDTTIQKIMVAFDFDRLFDESTMWMITPTEAGQDFNDLTGLIDVNMTNISNTSTTRVFKAFLDYGTAINPIKFKGGVLADFTLRNDTTNAVIVITSVVENVGIAGQYLLTAPAFIVGNIYTINVVKTGYTGTYQFTA
jgi:hypothetical protein